MKKNAIIIAVGIMVAINLVMNIIDYRSPKKLAYVRSQDLVYAYDGMKMMQLKFQAQTRIWEANMDTLRMEYQGSWNDYQQIIDQLSVEEKITRENLLRVQQNNIVQYSESTKVTAQEQEEKMLEGVLNQVNSFVEEYGKENGYDLILGTTMSGSILYGDEVIDITEELITEININYEGK